MTTLIEIEKDISKRSIYKDLPDPETCPYGWRYLKEVAEDGTVTYTGEHIPLRQEDLLHPEEDDKHIHPVKQNMNRLYLAQICPIRLAHHLNSLVLWDVRIDWNVAGIKPMGPDITIIMDTDCLKKGNPATYVAGVHGNAPEMVIEITSEHTYKNDIEHKFKLYQDVKLPYYYIVDTVSEEPKLYGYHLTDEGYIPVKSNEKGWIWVEPIQLWLGWNEDDCDLVACYREDGYVMTSLGEFQFSKAVSRTQVGIEEFEEARKRADWAMRLAVEEQVRAKHAKNLLEEERARAEQAEKRSQQLMTYLRAIGVDPEKILAESAEVEPC